MFTINTFPENRLPTILHVDYVCTVETRYIKLRVHEKITSDERRMHCVQVELCYVVGYELFGSN